MKDSGLQLTSPYEITEPSYNLNAEANIATLFTTGNGYIGVRGSLEEFGSVRIQGAYIRGVIDRIVEIPSAFADNVYMKKYYLNEEGLRHFEKQDCIVNFADFLTVRIRINGEFFYPWEGELLEWNRVLDMKNGTLKRQVRWKNSQGQITRFEFERFSSFDNDHVYAIRVAITPENYNGNVEILSGIDRTVKTNGQFICLPLESSSQGNRAFYTELSGESFRFAISTGCISRLYDQTGEEITGWQGEDGEDIIGSRASFDARQSCTVTLEKLIYVITSRDIPGLDPYAAGAAEVPDEPEIISRTKAATVKGVDVLAACRYADCFAAHLQGWSKVFSALDVQIQGDDTADRSLRFSNYHTAITLERNGHVHSLSAKGLTGDIYNNFVWWDCEIYQLPVFFHTMPESAKNALLYRYDKLDAARKNAKKENMSGARFPFTSSVTGEETVWIYARHPFLQIHIVADVAFGVLNYYRCTGDKDFIIHYGLEILFEICRWWADRVTLVNGRYELHNVTGTDEHHPYVNNNAYTNYEVCFVLEQAVKLYQEFRDSIGDMIDRIHLADSEVENWKQIFTNFYLPMEPNGMIPQFDGYFDLNRKLEVVGQGSATNFQMKQSGLYHKSQVIKQPDVLLLFTYLNMETNQQTYARNYDYYINRCESSSSLSYPVHAIAAADVGQLDTAYEHFLKSARLDMDDEHNCAWQGLHTACAAGAWLAAVRGFGGVILKENGVKLNPHMIPWWKSLSFTLVWHGCRLVFALTQNELTVEADSANSQAVPLCFRDEAPIALQAGEKHSFCTAPDARVSF